MYYLLKLLFKHVSHQIYEQQILVETGMQTLSRTKVQHIKLEEYRNCQNVHTNLDGSHVEVGIVDKVELAKLPYREDTVSLTNV